MVNVGDTFAMRRVFTQAEYDAFAALSGDDNPIHVDPAFAARTRFGRTAAHGMLLYSVTCGLLSRHFPGARQTSQEFMFTAPTFCDEEMTFRAEVIEVMTPRRQIRMKTTITDPAGETTAVGETILVWEEE